MPQQLEKYLRDVCAKNNLTVIDVSLHANAIYPDAFIAYAHWAPFGRELPCAVGSADTLEGAIALAVNGSHQARRALIREQAS